MRKVVVTTIVLFVSSSVFAAPEFVPYEGDDAVRFGSGGSKEMYKDVEVWVTGTPSKEFEVLGFLTDRRHKTGLVGKIRMGGLEKAMAKAANEAGGNALIKLDEYSETTGYVGNANTNGNGYANGYSSSTNVNWNSNTNYSSSAVQKNNSSYAVIRYVEAAELSSLSSEQITSSAERCLAFPLSMNDRGEYFPSSNALVNTLGTIWVKNGSEFLWETRDKNSGEFTVASGKWGQVSEGLSTVRNFEIGGKNYQLASGSNILAEEGGAHPIAWLECS